MCDSNLDSSSEHPLCLFGPLSILRSFLFGRDVLSLACISTKTWRILRKLDERIQLIGRLLHSSDSQIPEYWSLVPLSGAFLCETNWRCSLDVEEFVGAMRCSKTYRIRLTTGTKLTFNKWENRTEGSVVESERTTLEFRRVAFRDFEVVSSDRRISRTSEYGKDQSCSRGPLRRGAVTRLDVRAVIDEESPVGIEVQCRVSGVGGEDWCPVGVVVHTTILEDESIVAEAAGISPRTESQKEFADWYYGITNEE